MQPPEVQHLQSLTLRALVVAPIRLAAGLGGLAGAVAAGAPWPGALLAFGAAAVGLLVIAAADPRTRFQRLPDDPPAAAATAVEDGVTRLALAAVYPSTIGVAALLVVALAFEPTLSAVLAGILVGLGLAALLVGGEWLLHERRTGRRLFLLRGTQRVVARDRPVAPTARRDA